MRDRSSLGLIVPISHMSSSRRYDNICRRSRVLASSNIGGIGMTGTFVASCRSSGGNCEARKEGRYFARERGIGGTIQYVAKTVRGLVVLCAIKMACPFGACGSPRKNCILMANNPLCHNIIVGATLAVALSSADRPVLC